MEIGVWPGGGGVEPAAARGDGGLKRLQCGEMRVDHRLVDQRPEMFSRLQLRTVGRQEHQADPVGDGEILRPVPAGIVEHQDDVALAPGAGLPGEGGEQFREEGLRQAGRE